MSELERDRRIVALLELHRGRWLDRNAIAAQTGYTRQTVSEACKRLYREGKIEKLWISGQRTPALWRVR